MTMTKIKDKIKPKGKPVTTKPPKVVRGSKAMRQFKRFMLATNSIAWSQASELQYLLGLSNDSETFRYALTRLAMAIRDGERTRLRLVKLAASVPYNPSEDNGNLKAMQIEERGDLNEQLEFVKKQLDIDHDYRAFALAIMWTHRYYHPTEKEQLSWT